MTNVIGSIVSNDLCVGCGVCVAACPDGILKIYTDRWGEYKPFLAQKCVKDCGLCYKVCPFGTANQNEDEISEILFGSTPNIRKDPTVGNYIASFVGHVASEPQRVRSASGGLASWLLSKLFQEGKIDAAICVLSSNEPARLFKYSVIKDIESIESSSGSAYYPVQLSDSLLYILSTPGRYAITALPCFAKGIRLAQMRSKILMERIVCVIGITCGQMKSKHYTEYLAKLSGVKGEISKVNYRGKDAGRVASDYFYSCENTDGKNRKIFWSEGVSEVWLSRWFTLNPCNYCDDVFAECADAVCMDAWLPEYSSDWRGTSLALIRNPVLLELINDGAKKGEIITASVSYEKVIQSQKALITFKRGDLGVRLWLAKKEGVDVPVKRVTAKRDSNQLNIIKSRLIKDTQRRSKESYLEWRDGNISDIAYFRKGMEPYQRKLRTLEKGVTIYHILNAAIRKIRGGCR